MNRRAVLAAPLLLAGCASLLPKQKYIPRVSWPLDPQPPQIQPTNETGKVLLLRDLAAAPGMETQAIQTLNADGSLTLSYYNQWAAVPARAATGVLRSWLTASGAFRAVVSPGSRLNPDLIVEGELTALMSDPARGRAVAVMTLLVIQDTHGDTRPLAQRRITGTAPLSGSGYAAQVAAQTAALANAMDRAVAFISGFA